MGRARSLDPYRRKRDPARTPEPFAAPARPAANPVSPRFVVQQHAARRLHWDLRLEIDGVLVSWAVPRGPSVAAAERRLAVQTEDHPLEYADFEGLIPAGNYGAGAMIVWDAGRWTTVDGVAPADGLVAGKLDLALYGHKLRGRWALVRTKGGDGRQWLFFKKADAAAGGVEPVAALPASVLSGLTVDELRDGVRRDAELAAAATAAGAPRAALAAAALRPMLATPAAAAFDRDGWLFELKYDGIRLLLVRHGGGGVHLKARSGRDVTAQFPEIAAAAARLPCEDFAIDGELIALDQRGAGSFETLQTRLGLSRPHDVARGVARVPLQCFAFDLLAVAGHDLRGLPTTARKALLARLVPARGVIRYAEHVETRGLAFFAAAAEHDVEGIVAKRAAAPYRSGLRSRDWLKIKRPREAAFAIVGYVPGKGSRATLGALMLARRDGDELRHVGNVGSGLSGAQVDSLLPQLQAARRTTPAFTPGADPLPRQAVFVAPRLDAMVRYTERTERGMLRQPVLLRVAEPAPELPATPAPSAPSAAPVIPRRRAATATPRVALSNLDKVFWPADGITKGDLLAYYDAIWPHLAPYLRDRPLVLTRYPDGIDGKSFFQKHVPPFVPDWLETCRVADTEYFLCNDREALRYVVNLGTIPLHIWSARRQQLERPDWAILDLDPKGAPRSHVVAVARHAHALLAPLGVPHFIKTSGQEGLHILLPLGGQLTHDEARALSEVLARLIAADLPAIATVARPLGARHGKVYLDFLQNGYGKTIAAPFAVRPRPGAPVSTPLAWSEVTARLDPARHTMRTVPARIARRGDPLAPLLTTPVDVAALLAALRARLAE